MKILLVLIILLSSFLGHGQISVGVTNYGGYMELIPHSNFTNSLQTKDKSIAKGTTQFKFVFKDVESNELLKNVQLKWSYKDVQGQLTCDDSQTVLTLDRKRINFEAHLKGYDSALLIIKPKNQYYYEYIVYLKRTADIPVGGNK